MTPVSSAEKLIRCRSQHCGTRYARGGGSIRWYFGHYEGTSDEFNAEYRIPDDVCPVCRTPEFKS
jgi:hypothetical protein